MNTIETWNWTSMKVFFSSLNAAGLNYVVLRNYHMLPQEQFLEDHPDIDILCNDPKEFLNISKAVPRSKKDDGIHYKMLISSKEVAIDIRWVGDGYLDKKWEKNILQNRINYKNFCYIPDSKDEYFSILYHVIIQKNNIAENYMRYITSNLPERTKEYTRDELIKVLEEYMFAEQYHYTCPIYPYSIFNHNGINPKLIQFLDVRWIKRIFLSTLKRLK